MKASLSQLVEVRSELADEIIRYCSRLLEKLDHTPWYRKGTNVCVSEVAVPVRVLRESTGARMFSFNRDADRFANPHGRESSRYYVDPELATFYEETLHEERQEEVPWLAERERVRRAIVVGGPGSGKSFLTQITGIDLARDAIDAVQRKADLEGISLPIHFTLASFAKSDLAVDPTAALLQLVRDEWAPSPHFMNWLEKRLHTRSTWLLLDALDEVPDEHRPTLIKRFRAIHGQTWQTRLLLTCRAANWARELIPWPELTEYELAPLNLVEVRQFVGRWFANGDGRHLSEALNRNYPLAHAARTPLITTFLCLAHEELPLSPTTRRVELYSHVVRGLARRAWKEQPLAKTDPHVDDLVRFLVHISRPLFERHPAGNLFSHSEISVEFKSTGNLPVPLSALKARRAGQPMPPSETWPTLIRDELLEAGILAGAGLQDGLETQFAFAHRSLLEYLVARNLNNVVSESEKGWKKIESFLDHKSWHPAWHETIAFLAGMLDNPEPLLHLLGDPTKDAFTRPRLCLAGLCLPELRGSDRAASLEEEPVDRLNTVQLAEELFRIWWQNEISGHRFLKVSNALPCIGAACVTSLVDMCLRGTRMTNSEERVRSIDALGKLGPSAATILAVERLMECLNDRDRLTREKARNVLKQRGEAVARHEHIVSHLLTALSHLDEQVRGNAVSILGRVGEAGNNPLLVGPIIQRLTDKDNSVRMEAAEAVGFIAELVERCPDELIKCFRNDRSISVRSRAAEALGRLRSVVSKDTKALSALIDSLRDPAVGQLAAELIGRLGEKVIEDAEIFEKIFVWMNDEDPEIRACMIVTLGRLAIHSMDIPGLYERVVRGMCDETQYLRVATAEALGRMGEFLSPQNAQRFAESLDDSVGEVRSAVVRALGQIRVVSISCPGVIERLCEVLESDHLWSVRAEAAQALGQMEHALIGHTRVREQLFCSLRDDDPDVRASSAWSLGRIFNGMKEHHEVIDALLRASRDSARGVRAQSISSLAKLADGTVHSMDVKARILEALLDVEAEVRTSAVLAMGEIRRPTEEAIQCLLNALKDSDVKVRKSAIESLEMLMAKGWRIFRKSQSDVVLKHVDQLSY